MKENLNGLIIGVLASIIAAIIIVSLWGDDVPSVQYLLFREISIPLWGIIVIVILIFGIIKFNNQKIPDAIEKIEKAELIPIRKEPIEEFFNSMSIKGADSLGTFRDIIEVLRGNNGLGISCKIFLDILMKKVKEWYGEDGEYKDYNMQLVGKGMIAVACIAVTNDEVMEDGKKFLKDMRRMIHAYPKKNKNAWNEVIETREIAEQIIDDMKPNYDLI